MNSRCLLLNLLVLILIQVHLSHSDGLYNTCNGSFSCRNISGFGYPFRRHQDPTYCGYPGFEINCDEQNPPTIDIMNITYQILSINPTSQVLRVIREDMVDSICPQDLVNTTIDPHLFNYTSSYMNSSLLFGCPVSFHFGIIGSVFCGTNGTSPVFLVPGAQGPGICQTSVVIPFPVAFKMGLNSTGLVQVLQEGFELRWKVESRPCTDCTQSGGQCVYDMNKLATTCACPEPPLLADSCSSPSLEKGSKETAKKLILGFSCGFGGILLLLLVILCQKKRLWETRKNANHKVEIFIKNYETLALKRFSYSEIKKITNSFVEILGKGGYGSVYKGHLPDGQLVAVKLLAGTQGDGEDFINEVASIGRTSHVNIVTLLGFCIEGKKRTLIYEFMPNGSLDKFLRPDGSHLDNTTLFQVAKGIARGLEYLHRGCNTRIVHFDIKPHNILLDEEFVPKISDFGLAKLCKRKESIVSVMGARGTAGYMAPEVFFRSLGGASHKSDVYSYGMMALEMAGAHRNNKVSATSTSEAYFPDWVYKQIESGSNLGDQGVTTEYEEELARKMMIVSLWCIQSDPSDRPSISKVVEMLEGSFESLQVPPRRFWSSDPSRPAQGTSPSATQSSSGEILSSRV